MQLRIKNLFSSLVELVKYCEQNPDFPKMLGMESALELWEFNVEIPIMLSQ